MSKALEAAAQTICEKLSGDWKYTQASEIEKARFMDIAQAAILAFLSAVQVEEVARVIQIANCNGMPKGGIPIDDTWKFYMPLATACIEYLKSLGDGK